MCVCACAYTVCFVEKRTIARIINRNKVFYMTNAIPLLNWKITNLIELKAIHEILVRDNNCFNHLFDIASKVSATVTLGNTVSVLYAGVYILYPVIIII